MTASNPDQVPRQQRYLEEICKIDRDQAPHGLYSMREALADEFRKKNAQGLPPMSQLLAASDPRTGIAHRMGWASGNSHFWRSGMTVEEGFSFTVPGSREVTLRLATHASTKIRHYGDGYVLDKVHGKKPPESPDFLESAVPRVSRDARDAGKAMGLLFIAHIHTPRAFRELLGKTTEAAFLERYGVSFHSQTWEDIHGRDFHTRLFLWVTEALA